MSGILSLMVGSGSGGGSVNVVGGTVTDTTVSPADASVTYFLNSSGSEASTPSTISGTWLVSGAAADYDVRATVTAGAVTSGSDTGSWLNMAVSRQWGVERTPNGSGVNTASLTIEMRSASTLAVLDTASVVLTAEVTI